MMPASTIEQHQEESSTNGAIPGRSGPFANLRGVQWRVNLGILPPSSSIDDLRRVTADSRRRYAGLRRRLLVDPHLPKDGSNSPDPIMDNPLSQNPGPITFISRTWELLPDTWMPRHVKTDLVIVVP
ncbi:hypothetical protein Pint_14022 [Pistacia integerrima]|uniref:Uncharacterized protein n=1 Tax=Pistacia integerrima TaxID=434235 RepID=A0ACC0Y9N6_9ROSI|nr:hypothetical protein Pint_14022 [Pistacia integerrima]